VINLENESYESIWGENSQIPYLATELKAKGLHLPNYFGIGHLSLTNYIAQISGQGPNVATQADCTTFTDFASTGTGEYGQELGEGCVYPSSVETIASQLTAANLTWKSYQEDMAATGETTCRHPEIGGNDPTLGARPGDAYATRHNPFVYFHGIIDGPECNNVVDLNELDSDLSQASTTPNLSYITPNLCNDGHDEPCKDGQPGGMTQANEWLKTWVPKIMDSAAFKAGGVLIITFDEAEVGGGEADASACCELTATANTANPGLTGPGGGRIGALLLGPDTKAATDETAYSHYSLLCSLEDAFGFEHLGYAAHPSTKCFPMTGGEAKPSDL
jgi:hypothetical protein